MPIQQSSRSTNILEAAGNSSSLRGSGSVTFAESYKGSYIKNKQQAVALLAQQVKTLKSKSSDSKPSDENKEETKVPLSEILNYLHLKESRGVSESTLKDLVQIAAEESIDNTDRKTAVEILKANFDAANKRVGNVADSDVALNHLLTVMQNEISGNTEDARDSAISVASIIESDSFNNTFFENLSRQKGSALGMIGDYVRSKTKYLEYVSTLPTELIKSIEPGDNTRISSLSDSDKEFREYLAERLLSKHYQIKEDAIRVTRDLTLEPVRIKAAEIQQMRGEDPNQPSGNKHTDKVLSLRDVLKKMAAAKNSKERAAAVASYYEMNNILEYRFGKEVENIKAAEEQTSAGAAVMPGTTISPQDFKNKSERSAKKWAAQLEALHLAVKSPAIMGDFKGLFEESLKQYSVMLLASDLPSSINTITQPELSATFRKEMNKLRENGYAPTSTNDLAFKREADLLTDNYDADKEKISNDLLQAFFGKDTLSSEDILQAKAFANIANPDTASTDRAKSLVNLKSEIIENFISEKVIYDDAGNIDITQEGMQKLFEKYIDPITHGTGHSTGGKTTLTINDLRNALNETNVFDNLINHWRSETVSFVPHRTTSNTAAKINELNELEKLRPTIIEHSFNELYTAANAIGATVPTISSFNDTVKDFLSNAIKKGAFQETVINSGNFEDVLETLEGLGHGAFAKSKATIDALNSYASNKNKVTTIVTEIFTRLQNPPAASTVTGLTATEAFERIATALNLKETSIVGDKASFQEDLGNSISDLYNKITTEDPDSSDKRGGHKLLRAIIGKDEDLAKRLAPRDKLLMQGERGYYEYVMTKDAGFVSADGTGFDSELRLISLGRLIQEVNNSTAHPQEKQAAVDFIESALKENSSKDFTTRVSHTMLAEAERILGSRVFDNFHTLQRKEANFGLARAKVENKKNEISSGMLHRILSRSVKKETGILGQFKSILEKVVSLISGGESKDLGEKLASENDPDLGVFKKAFDIATGNRTADYGYRSHLKDSKEVDPEHRDSFFKTLTNLDRIMAAEEYPSSPKSSSGTSSSVSKPVETRTEKEPVEA